MVRKRFILERKNITSKAQLISTLTYLSLDVKMIFHHKILLYQMSWIK